MPRTVQRVAIPHKDQESAFLACSVFFPAGKRVLLVSHGGALHAAHRAARGYAARGKVINCGISIMMAEPHSSCVSGSGSTPSHQQQQQQQDESALPLPPQQQQHGCEQSAFYQQQQQVQQQNEQVQQQQHSSDSVPTGSMAMDTKPDSKQHGCCIDLCADSSASGQHTCTDGMHCSRERPGGCSEASKQRAKSNGRLALLVWNDGHELVAHGMLDAASFGGSAKEA
jgi:hypothetical protein